MNKEGQAQDKERLLIYGNRTCHSLGVEPKLSVEVGVHVLSELGSFDVKILCVCVGMSVLLQCAGV